MRLTAKQFHQSLWKSIKHRDVQSHVGGEAVQQCPSYATNVEKMGILHAVAWNLHWHRCCSPFSGISCWSGGHHSMPPHLLPDYPSCHRTVNKSILIVCIDEIPGKWLGSSHGGDFRGSWTPYAPIIWTIWLPNGGPAGVLLGQAGSFYFIHFLCYLHGLLLSLFFIWLGCELWNGKLVQTGRWMGESSTSVQSFSNEGREVVRYKFAPHDIDEAHKRRIRSMIRDHGCQET